MNKSHPFSFRCIEKTDFYDEEKDFYVDFKSEEESTFLFTMDLSSNEALILDRIGTGDIRIGDIIFDKRTSDFYIFSFHFYIERDYPRSFGFKLLSNTKDLYLLSELTSSDVRFSYIGNIFQNKLIGNSISASCPSSTNYDKMIEYFKEINLRIEITSKEHYQKSINLLQTQIELYEIEKDNGVWDIYFDVKDIINVYGDNLFINNYLKTGQFLVFNNEFFENFINNNKKKHYAAGYNTLNKREKENFEILKYIIFYFDKIGIIKYKSLYNGKHYALSDLMRMNPKPFIVDNYYAYYHLAFDEKDYIEKFIELI